MKYIAFFDTSEFAHEHRSIDLAGANVVEYISEVLSRFENVEIISPCRSLNKSGFYPGRKKQISDKITLHIPPSFGSNNKIARIVSIIWIQIWLISILLFDSKRGERIVVYHSLSTMRIIKLMKWLKNYQLTLEIREIYADVLHSDIKYRIKELKYFQIADSYIFPTSCINEQINIYNKPCVIASGIYKDEPRLSDKYDDDKIHLIYAGTLDRLKSGALRCVDVAEYLDERFVLHILGKGIPETLEELKNKITKVDSKCLILYDGVLRGDDFKRYVQRCHIGLALQDLSGNYNLTSFPSKILTYLANGLEVVSPKIPAIFKSPVSESLIYYEHDSPKDIAEVIKSISLKNNNQNRTLNQLDNIFEHDLSRLFYGR